MRQSHHIHIPFNHQHSWWIAVGLFELVETKQFLALVEDGRLGRVEVFGGSITRHPSTETDDPAATIPDRKHDPVAESVIATALILLDQHAEGDELLFLIPTASQ